MSIDNELEILSAQAHNEIFDNQRDVRDAVIAAALSTFPIGGAAIQSLISGKAQQRVWERFLSLLDEMRNRLNEIQGNIADEQYFASEEFQTLLGLALEQLNTTRDRGKLKLLANALVNSASVEFSDEQMKEQNIRLLREVSSFDLSVLRYLAQSLRPFSPTHDFIVHSFREGERPETLATECVASSLSRLVAMGLITETLVVTRPSGSYGSATQDAERLLEHLLSAPQERSYMISSHGRQFFDFLAHDSTKSSIPKAP